MGDISSPYDEDDAPCHGWATVRLSVRRGTLPSSPRAMRDRESRARRSVRRISEIPEVAGSLWAIVSRSIRDKKYSRSSWRSHDRFKAADTPNSESSPKSSAPDELGIKLLRNLVNENSKPHSVPTKSEKLEVARSIPELP